jgi:LmbE family N-acetylglucosaminyl deacetylase
MGFDRFGSAALVVAHPDDEVLWFSSIVGKVSRLIIAYEACDELPGLARRRNAASAAYPLPNAIFLRRAEPCSLSHVDWLNPVATDYGMALNRQEAHEAEARYRKAHSELRADLARLLDGVTDVFTHNPWGEYGHPDHVQVSRVVRSLGAQLGFRSYFSSYVAPRSARFATQFTANLHQDLLIATDRALADRIKALYLAHGCWTWHTEYVAPETEAFLTHNDGPRSESMVGEITFQQLQM